MSKDQINILGTDYNFTITTENENPILKRKYGNCNSFEREIFVESEYSSGEEMHPLHINLASRHEIIHAFISESGFKIEHCEDMINWIATMFPKMLKVFEQLGVVE